MCVISKNQQMQMAPWVLQLGMLGSPSRCGVSSSIKAVQRGPGARWNAQVGETHTDWHRVDTHVLARLGLFCHCTRSSRWHSSAEE